MVLIANDSLLSQLKAIRLEHTNKTKFSVLIGTLDPENNDITAYSVVHFYKQNERNYLPMFPSDIELPNH